MAFMLGSLVNKPAALEPNKYSIYLEPWLVYSADKNLLMESFAGRFT